MNRLAIGAVAAMILAAAAPGLARTGGPAAPPPAGTTPPATPPPAGTTPPGPAAGAPPATPPAGPEIVIPADPPPAANQPAPQAPPPPAPIDIPLDAAYPNGVQDPPDPFANSVRADNDRDAGFPWGLLGLLGLLGLFPLLRGYGHRNAALERERTVIRRDGE
ncbi:MAG TPA: hypothetical protein VEX35_05510 [Allosphingosinicella sp.]|nr:hypothetical protein [Allosphingosinicella sp.]